MIINSNSKGMSVALGMFDGVHIGHREVINAALKQKGLTPAVFTFRLLSGTKGVNILPYKAKFDALKAAGIQSIYSSDFDSVKDLSAEEFVQQILLTKMNCVHVCCGWNFRFSKNAAADSNELKHICEKHSIGVDIVPPVSLNVGGKNIEISSTRIREALKNGEIELANQMLGSPLTYELEVVEGEKLGRKLNAPTINQIIPDDCVLPKFGVYKTRVTIDTVSYPAVTNIGIKPTAVAETHASDAPEVTVETHIPGFNMDLYGQTVKVSLERFIRDEKKFNSLDELMKQIQNDIKEVLGN